jgi:hypothetical protein
MLSSFGFTATGAVAEEDVWSLSSERFTFISGKIRYRFTEFSSWRTFPGQS